MTRHIQRASLSYNAEIHELPDELISRRRAEFASTAARSAFGRRYPAGGHDGFVDRAPGELAIMRAARGLAT